MTRIFSIPRWTSLAAALLVSSVALSGCGDDEEPGSAPETESTPTSPTSSDEETGSTPPSLASSDATTSTPPNPSFGDYSAKPRTFTSEVADVPFTIDVPGGWTALERDAGIAQFWEGKNEELSIAELTVLSNIAGTAAEVRREFEVALEGSASSPPHRARYGPYTGVEIEARRPLNGLPGGYRLPSDGEATVVIFDVDGRGVTVVLDAFADIEPPGQVARMLRKMGAMLRTIRFT